MIVTSERMTAKEALELYKSRDGAEKLFRGDKAYLGNKSLRVASDQVAAGKIFVEFVALIVRNRIYTFLKDEMKKTGKEAQLHDGSGSFKRTGKDRNDPYDGWEISYGLRSYSNTKDYSECFWDG